MANLDVDNVRFTPVRLRTGYDMGEVDAYLDQVKAHLLALDAAVEGTGPAPAPLAPAFFSPVRLREGYDISEVDAFLDQVDAEDARLRSLARTGTAPAASPSVEKPTPPPVIREVGSHSANLVLLVLVLAALLAIVLVLELG